MKRVFITLFITVFVSLLCCSASGADIDINGADSFDVSGIFSDNMVLQQNEPIRIFGTSVDEGAYVFASIDGNTALSKVIDGKWEINLPPMTASERKYNIEIYGSEQADYVVFTDVSIGDVWLIIGQSNVEYKFGNLKDYDTYSENITGDENLSIFYINSSDYKKVSSDSAYSVESEKWYKTSHPMMTNASALGVCLGLELVRISENTIPVGIVSLGFAGQELACFVPEEISEKLSGYGDKSLIYDNFIAPFEKFPIKGLVWYQGEANAAYYTEYADGLESFINNFRQTKNQNNKNFPFYIIELPPSFDKPQNYTSDDWQYIDFGNVRAVTGVMPMRTEACYICATSDTWSDRAYSNNLHPYNKSAIASRLALMICSAEWGFKGYDTVFAPTVKSITDVNGDGKVYDITYNNTGDGLKWFADEGLGFVAINESWGFADITVKITAGNKIRISSDEQIYSIRYGWNTSDVFGTDTGLCNSGGVPAAAFAYDTIVRPTPFGEQVKIFIVKIWGFVYRNKLIFALAFCVVAAAIVFGVIRHRKSKKSKAN